MSRGSALALLAFCFFLSGLAGLIYETVWTEQFALVFGTSELAVATVLAAYMAGLAAGAAIARGFLSRIRRPVLVYAVLELAIAFCALLVPMAVAGASRLQVLILGGLPLPPDALSLSSALFYLLTAVVILFLPTALMGATLPLLTRFAVRSDGDVGPRVGLLYAANTVGAATGTLVAAFLLLPRLGLGQTVLLAVGLNGLVFGVAFLLARANSAGPENLGPENLNQTTGPKWILPLVLLSGVVSFSWEVLWTRLLSHLLGGSLYAFGTMLATFLVGIGLGSAVASRLAQDRVRSERGFAVAQLGAALCSLTAYAAVDHLPAMMSGLQAGNRFQALYAVLVLLPGAFFFGTTFPFAVRILAGSASEAAAASARVYSWNTLGAIAGAVLTGFVLLPGLAFAGTASLAVATSLALALATAFLSRPRRFWLAAVAGLGLGVCALGPPETPWQVLRTSPLSGRTAQGEVAYMGVGRSATVLLIDEDGRWRLSTNGLPEAAIQPPGARVGLFSASRWMALLPVVSRPDTDSMLIVGLGAGLTLGSVPHSLSEVHVVELEPEVVAANHCFEAGRRALEESRVTVHLNDVRSALTLSDRQFDAIVSQPSHPWTSGSSHLYTREFFSLARQRLAPGGVFVQWIGLSYVDADLLRVLLATLVEVFSQVEVYQPFPGGSLLFLCGDETLMEAESAVRGYVKTREQWLGMGLLSAEDVLVDRLLTSEASRALASGAPLNTDYRNLIKIRSPRVLASPIGGGGARRLMVHGDPLVQSSSTVDGIFAVRRLIRRQNLERARRVASAISETSQREVALALTDVVQGRRRLGEKTLWQVLERQDSGFDEALAALILLKRRDLLAGRGPDRLYAWLGRSPEASVVVEAWQMQGLGQVASVRTLEEELASIEAHHALFEAANALRVMWRQASGKAELNREALSLFEPYLAFGPGAQGLMRRARLALLAQERDVAIASYIELVAALEDGNPAPGVVQQAAATLHSFPAEWQGSQVDGLRKRVEALVER